MCICAVCVLCCAKFHSGEHYKIGNFSVGNLLREANNPEVEDCMMNAKIVPLKITIGILMDAVAKSKFEML